LAAILSAGGVLTLLLMGNRLIEAADGAAQMQVGPAVHHADDHAADPAGHHAIDPAAGHADH
jgi:hypothetical protein